MTRARFLNAAVMAQAALYWPGGGDFTKDERELPGLPGGDWKALLRNLLSFFLSVGVVAAIVMILYAGFTLITDSSGDDAKKKKAQDILVWSLVGIIVMLLAYSIVRVALTLPFFSATKELPSIDTTAS